MVSSLGQSRLPAPFIVGAPRSGTTLLRLMLDSHPELAIPGETHFLFDLITPAADEMVTGSVFCERVVGHFTWGQGCGVSDEQRL